MCNSARDIPGPILFLCLACMVTPEIRAAKIHQLLTSLSSSRKLTPVTLWHMPSDHFASATSSADVLSRVAQMPGLSGLAKQLVPVGKLRDVYRRVQRSPDGFLLETLLSEMRVELRVNAAESARIPATGPVVVVANHPFGVLDGAVLTVLLTRVRPDVKIVTNFLLGDVPELQRHCIFVDPFETDRSIKSNREPNRRALKECLRWLQRGGMLAVFPAGEVSHLQVPEAKDRRSGME
jgi:Acyltransferase